jgi:hypothetical protein
MSHIVLKVSKSLFGFGHICSNRSGGNQENELHGIGWNHYEQAVVIDFIANNSE